MKNNIISKLLLLLTIILSSCSNKNEDLNFYSCEFESIDWNNPKEANRWIDNKQEAEKSKLTFYNLELNKRDLDSLYKTTAQYLFVIGGGGIWVEAEKCSSEIKNDTIFIKYKPTWNTAEVGEASSSLICLEINKVKYPNYKKMKIVYIQQEG